ncbi:MAG TPA: 50S ribosomal protein L11 methyltransferase [Solirubrobacterales bacterium]|nr:50S ribosomal protein L11 methyltransferase [Solirubrobacterales bacterium]
MIRLTVRCATGEAERVLAELLELAPGGVEEEHGDGWVEYSIYGPPGELPELPPLTADDGLLEITSTEIPDDWADTWRDFHKPVLIQDGRIVVQPSWEEGPRAGGDITVVIDPGQAFGTGAHATTSLCLEFLLELADAREAHGPLVDLGTGSGVLAIAAAKLGWSPVRGVDSELPALDAAAENARANGVDLELERSNLRIEEPPTAPTTVANLTAPLLEEVATRIRERPRVLVCSGLLATEVDRVSAAFAPVSLLAAETRVSGDWAGILFRAE